MNARMDTLRSLAETDPYYRGYLDGLFDKHGIRGTAPDGAAWREYARLTQARIERNTDPTDYDAEWCKVPNAADLGAPRIG